MPTGQPFSFELTANDGARTFQVSASSPQSGHFATLFEDVTADFVYMRLHGSTELYNSRYTHEELTRWAGLIRLWAETGDVFCYFDNTDKLHAPDNAQELMEMLGLRVPWQPIAHASPGTTTAGWPRSAGSQRTR